MCAFTAESVVGNGAKSRPRCDQRNPRTHQRDVWSLRQMRYTIIGTGVGRSFPKADPFLLKATKLEGAEIAIYIGAPFRPDPAKQAIRGARQVGGQQAGRHHRGDDLG
jgi:hypothetical protein